MVPWFAESLNLTKQKLIWTLSISLQAHLTPGLRMKPKLGELKKAR